METNGSFNNDYKQYEKQYRNNSKGMFRTFIAWNGRIRRLEYAIYFVVCVFIASFARTMERRAYFSDDDSDWWLWWFVDMVAWLLLIIAATKRSHDTGSSGWNILIPFYGFILLFKRGDKGINKYGSNPKRPYADQIDELLRQDEDNRGSGEMLNGVNTSVYEKTTNDDTNVADIFDYKQDSPSFKYEDTASHQFVSEPTTNNKQMVKESSANSNKTILTIIIICILVTFTGFLLIIFLSNGTSLKTTVYEDKATKEVSQPTSESSEADTKPDPWEEELANFNAQMEEQVRLENEEAGKYVANGIKMINAQYDAAERVITFNYEVTNIVVETLPDYPKSEQKKDIMNELKSGGGWQAAMKDYGLKVKYILYNKKGKIVRSIELTSSDL